ncbi:MAG TPA: cell division protein FtsI [Eubacterium sp.]|jgi:stage V sporulation protein D (sporulation-specific penicillin-binding protein)|nr:cell division protein FtsI [Eubacterium sp.]
MDLKLTQGMKKRILVILVALCIGVTGIVSGVLFKVSVIDSKELSAMATDQQQSSFDIKAKRGTIYDRNNKVLAQSATVWDVIISPGDIEKNEPENREFICKGISEILGVKYETLTEACKDTSSRYYVVKKKVDRSTVEKINNFVLKNNLNRYSVYTVENSERSYPNGTLAASVLGFVNENEEGYGIEAYYNSYLKGTDGRVITTTDAHGNAMPYDYSARYSAKDGNSLVLTIDETLQYYLEKNLEITVSQHKLANRSTGIIMNAKTGAIVAMATSPGFDPNDPSHVYFESDRLTLAKMSDDKKTEEEILAKKQEIWGKQWQNKAVSELYIPGSVFKMFTCASALEEEVVSLDSTFECSGIADVAGTKIRCWNIGGHGVSNLTEAMIRSCNPAFIKIGQLLGVEKFSKYFEAFGFTEKTGIDLPGEADSLYVKESDMGIVELSSSAFGQTTKVTPIQMVTAAAAVVNGGKLVTPYVVDKIIDSDGNVVKSAQTVVRRQVISEETSATMRKILEDVVTANGGGNAYMSGYRIGGKSGTSEKIDDYNSGKTPELRYVATFCAIVPIDDPEYVMLVVCDEPTSGYIYGSAIAAPVVSAVFKEGLEYMGIYPQYTADELAQQDVTVPWVGGYNSIRAEAQLTAAGLKAEYIGSTDGTEVTGQVPSAGTVMPSGSTVMLYMGDIPLSDYRMSTVPNVIGMTVEGANKALSEAGLNISITGAATGSEAKAVSQSVNSGLVVYRGSVIEVNFLVNNETG